MRHSHSVCCRDAVGHLPVNASSKPDTSRNQDSQFTTSVHRSTLHGAWYILHMLFPIYYDTRAISCFGDGDDVGPSGKISEGNVDVNQ